VPAGDRRPSPLATLESLLLKFVAHHLGIRSSAPRIRPKACTKPLEACAGDRPVDLRDQALLLTAFAYGGWRRSKVRALHLEDLAGEEPVRADPSDKDLPSPACLSIRLGRPVQWGNVDRRALTPQSINLILKRRCQQVGLDATLFSAHALRSGYLTEAANRGIPLPEAMQQSLHKSVTQAASYYNNAERKNGRASPADRLD